MIEPPSARRREVTAAVQWLLLLSFMLCVGAFAARARQATSFVTEACQQARAWWHSPVTDHTPAPLERDVHTARAASTSDRGSLPWGNVAAGTGSGFETSAQIEPSALGAPIVQAQDLAPVSDGPELAPGPAAADLALEPSNTILSVASEGSREGSDSGARERRLKLLLREGRHMLKIRDLQAAERTFRRALALRPSHLGALSGLARTLLGQGEIDRAREVAEMAVRLAPYQAAYHVVLADVLRISGDWERAESEYRRATDLSRERSVDRVARALPPNPF